MFRNSILGRMLVTLFIAALLIGGGYALYRTGWDQGYQTAALVSSQGTPQGQGNSSQPAFPFPYWPRFYYGPFFNPFGLFFGIGIFFLIFFLVRFLFWGIWGRPWGYGPRHWGYGYPYDPNDPSMKEYREWKERQSGSGSSQANPRQGE